MSLLNKSIKKALAIKSITEQYDAPEQAAYIKVPSEDEAFQSKLGVAELVVIEEQYKNTDYKVQYIVDPDLIEHLDRKHYRTKVLHVVKTESGELKSIMIPAKTKNSWHVSNYELLMQAQTSPVIAKRDVIAKVYEAHKATGITPIVIIDEDVQQAYANAFGQYEIADLNHPALVGKLKSSPTIDAVDEPEIELLDDTDAVEANLPKSGSLEELQEIQQPVSSVKNELELEDIYLDEDEDEDELEFEEISLDDIDINEEAA